MRAFSISATKGDIYSDCGGMRMRACSISGLRVEVDEVRVLKSSKRLRHEHSTGLGFILCPYRD